jgi:hypothetical protein
MTVGQLRSNRTSVSQAKTVVMTVNLLLAPNRQEGRIVIHWVVIKAAITPDLTPLG